MRTTAPVSPVALILRARGDTVRLKVVLESFGYYQSAVSATINGQALSGTDLADTLAAQPAGKDATVVVTFVPGPQYRVGRITLDGDLPPALRGQLHLRTGQPAIAEDVLAAGRGLLTALQDQGYAFATVDPPVAYELPDTHELDVTFKVHTGAVARFGAIDVTGLKRTKLSAVLSRIRLHRGDQYSAQAVDKARASLLGMGVFGTVDVRIAKQPDADGSVPVTFRVTERKRHAVTLNAAYSTDLGGSGGVTWSDRNLFGHAEQLDLHASMINLNGSATTGLGYDTGARVSVPEFLEPAQNLQLSLDAIQQSLLAYNQTAETAAVTLTRTLSKVWAISLGFSTKVDAIFQPQEQFVPNNLGKTHFYYTLFAIPVSLRYDSTDLSSPLIDPTHGLRAALTVSPTLSVGPPNATYVISQIRASAYLDLHDLSWTPAGRTIIAVRGLSGYAQGANVTDLPPDQRFYAGGSETVRGYRFQSVGPQFSDTAPADAPSQIGSNFSEQTPVGGVAVDAGSIELRQRVGTSYGFAVFVDAARIGDTALPFNGKYAVGVGTGVRYYTPIGPLRLDFALPLHRSPNDDRFEIYIGLGQSF